MIQDSLIYEEYTYTFTTKTRASQFENENIVKTKQTIHEKIKCIGKTHTTQNHIGHEHAIKRQIKNKENS